MPLELHSKFKAQLLPLLLDAITRSKVEGRFLHPGALVDFGNQCDQLLINKKELKAQLERFVGIRPFLRLAVSVIGRKLREANLSGDATQPLIAVAGFEDPVAIANEVLSTVDSLPRKYVCSIALPDGLTNQWRARAVPAVVGGAISIVGSWHDEAKQFPKVPKPSTPRLGFGAHGPLTLAGLYGSMTDEQKGEKEKPHTLTLHIAAEGLINDRYPTEPTDEAIRVLKSFLGLSLATTTLTKSNFDYSSQNVEAYFFDSAGTQVTQEILDPSLSKLVKAIALTEAASGDVADQLSQIFSILSGTPRSDQLVLAGRWLCDSHANDDRVMAFMQAAIVIEVLLGSGDGEQVGLTTMLANRCAYLLAQSTVEREAILSSFPLIYKTRSKIVHNGLGALKSEEARQFNELRKLCDRVIQVEIKQLLASQKVITQ